MSASLNALQDALCNASYSIQADQIEKLDAFLTLIDKWNRVYNLTAVRKKSDMIPRHIIDSLCLLEHLPATGNGRTEENHVDVIDIGSGAGLPCIPLAIARPDLRFMSIETIGKKTRFQQQVKLELKLDNLQVLQARAETVNAQADVVVSRAFTAPDAFLGYADRFLKPGGTVLVMLGKLEKLPQTLPAPFVIKSSRKVRIATLESERHIAVIEKQS